LKQINEFFIKIETLNMDDLLCWCNSHNSSVNFWTKTGI